MVRSNSPTLGPMLRLAVRRTPVTASMSCSVISGADSGILMNAAKRREQQRTQEYRNDGSAEAPAREERWLVLGRSSRKQTLHHTDWTCPVGIHEIQAFLPCSPLREYVPDARRRPTHSVPVRVLAGGSPRLR